MAAETRTAMDEARSLGLFRPQGAFEVHCGNCQARLNTRGDCSSCGLIGRSEGEIARQLEADPAGTEKMLRTQIARRRAYRPVKGPARD